MNNVAPINTCIYCRATDKPLTDEHTIAYGLSGDLVLPKASCLDCNTITGRLNKGYYEALPNKRALRLAYEHDGPTKRPRVFRSVS